MWDDALAEAQRTGKDAMIFDVDYVDTNSIRFRDSVLSDPKVQQFIRSRFVTALNDFSVDPPMSVGLDSLRNLGLRLSGLEDRYRLVLRPTVLLVNPDGTEIDRIILPQQLSPQQFIARVNEILEGRNTLTSYINTFWRDTSDVVLRLSLIDRFEERSMYDSVLKHLVSLSTITSEPELSREAELRYSYLKLNVEGKTAPLRRLLDSFTRSKEDSTQWVKSMLDLVAFYQKKKMPDSVDAFYRRIFHYTGTRDPDLLNDYAWELANFTTKYDSALAFVQQAILAKPNEANYYDTKAVVDAKLHNWAEAVGDATKALNLAAPEDKPYFQKQLDDYLAEMNEEMQKPKEKPTEGSAPVQKPAPAPKLKRSAKKS